MLRSLTSFAIASLGPSGVGKIISSNYASGNCEGSCAVATANDTSETNTDVVSAVGGGVGSLCIEEKSAEPLNGRTRRMPCDDSCEEACWSVVESCPDHSSTELMGTLELTLAVVIPLACGEDGPVSCDAVWSDITAIAADVECPSVDPRLIDPSCDCG